MTKRKPTHGPIDRREFGRLAAAGLAGLTGLAATPLRDDAKSRKDSTATVASKLLPGLRREKRGSLYYRPLGSTGLWVSELSLGGSPSPPDNVFLAAMDKGVNFCDTSPRYSEGRGEEGIGRAIKGRRDRFHVCTKFTPNRGGVMTTDAILKQVEGSLRRLGTDCIDVLSVHGANGEEDVLADWIFEAMDRLKQAGKARFFGASVHNTSVAFYRRLIESGRYQVLLIPFNMYYDRTNSSDEAVKGPDALRSVLRLAAEKGVGVIAMKTLAAGGLAKVAAPPGISPAQAKLRWVLRRPEITAIVNEMVTFDFLKEDLAASAADLSPAEEAWLRRCVRDSSDAVCRMCRSCEAACPAKIPIPDLLRLRMYAVDYGDRRRAAELANDVDAVSLLDICRQCGTCEATCPWGVRTTQLLEGLRQIVS